MKSKCPSAKAIYVFLLFFVMQGVAGLAMSCESSAMHHSLSAQSMSDSSTSIADDSASHQHHSMGMHPITQGPLDLVQSSADISVQQVGNAAHSKCCSDDGSCAMSHCHIPGILTLIDVVPSLNFSFVETRFFPFSPLIAVSSSLYRPPILS